MTFLISTSWVIGEAQRLHVHASSTEVRRTFDRIRREQFPKRGEFQKFLAGTGQTVADLMLRVRLNLLASKIQAKVIAGHPNARSRQVALQRFARAFRLRWSAQTYCKPAFAVADCGHVQASL